MKTKLKVIEGGDAIGRLELKIITEAIRVCGDRDSMGNLDAMRRKLKQMKATTHSKLKLVVADSKVTSA